ncbi:conserved hypothetical protein [Ricinus communis]|uniref:Uncharacterized protein n=1 Tax=Ricinus communis TaxID=3988 RepID=B9T7I3_RICCO|nr:conserved hypothetical protein [Ricinus communis]
MSWLSFPTSARMNLTDYAENRWQTNDCSPREGVVLASSAACHIPVIRKYFRSLSIVGRARSS